MVGKKLSNKSTSGHMICGVSRISVRSISATISFCGVTFIMVQFFNSSDIFINKPEQGTSYPDSKTAFFLTLVLLFVVLVYVLLKEFAEREFLENPSNLEIFVCSLFSNLLI
jgi:uncharacterized protein